MANVLKWLFIVACFFVLMASAWLYVGQPPDADTSSVLEEVLSRPDLSQETRARLRMADNDLKDDKKNRALDLMDEVFKTNPDPQLLGLYVMICLGEGWRDRALEPAKKMVEKRPDMVSYFTLGQVLSSKKMFAESNEAFKKVLGFSPDSVSAHAFMGGNYAKMGNFEKAEEEYRILQKLDSVAALNLLKVIKVKQMGRSVGR